jgi:hypothetical protein
MTITYDNTECTRITTHVKAPIILIENKAGIREPFLQKFITQEDFQRAVKNKPEPKYKKGLPYRLFYEGKALNNPTSYPLCAKLKKDLEQLKDYKYGTFKIEQK